MQKFFRCVAVLLALAAAASTAVAGQSRLSLTLNNGRATLIAQDVPLRDILAEWARVGKTTIVNGDKLTAPSVTLQLVDRPEGEVLELLLRSASGYIAAPRDAAAPGSSMFARVMILPVSRGPVGGATASTQPSPFGARPGPPVQPMPMPVADDDDEPAPNVFNANGQPVPQGQPQPPGMNPGVVGSPVQPNGQLPPGMGGPGQPVLTAPRPGMLPAPPAGQPNPYGAPVPPPVVRPGPGGPGGPGGLEPNDDDYPDRVGRGF